MTQSKTNKQTLEQVSTDSSQCTARVQLSELKTKDLTCPHEPSIESGDC